MFVHLKAIFSPSDEPSTMLGTTSANAATLPPSLVEFQSSAVDAPLSPDTESRAVAILPSTTSDAHTDVLSEPFLQRQDEDPKSSAVEAFSGANPVSSTQDVEIEHSEEGLSDLERPTAENTPE
ncbi:hypothetical protein AaE_011122, partial [Aphanomyces astaci]